MNETVIECGNCGKDWPAVRAYSIYEQQAVESRPCPNCGAYTLRLPELAEPRPARPRRAAA